MQVQFQPNTRLAFQAYSNTFQGRSIEATRPFRPLPETTAQPAEQACFGRQKWGIPLILRIENYVPFHKALDRNNGVTVYGSNRIRQESDDPVVYKEALKLGELLAKTINKKTGKPFYTVTGAGPGIMRLIHEGAMRVRGSTRIGSAMVQEFPGQPKCTDVVTHMFEHRYFTERVYGQGGFEHLSAHTIGMKGGTGTLHEIMMRAADLVYGRTHFPAQKVIPLLDPDGFFRAPGGLMSHLKYLVDTQQANEDFLKVLIPVNTAEEAVALLNAPEPKEGEEANPPQTIAWVGKDQPGYVLKVVKPKPLRISA